MSIQEITGQTFLTALAPEVSPGSRDPLGLEPVWSRMGRMLVGNVTTVSGDFAGWVTLLVSTGIAEWLAEARELSEQGFFDAFLRSEQVIAYSRAVATEGEVQNLRGIDRVRAQLSRRGKRPMPLGQSPEARILGNQRATGVWGQISAPARASGLLQQRGHRLTDSASAFVREHYLSPIEDRRRRLHLLAAGAEPFAPRSQDRMLALQLHALHDAPPSVSQRGFFREHVLYGSYAEHRDLDGATLRGSDRQQQLVQLWRETAQIGEPVGPSLLAYLEEEAERRGQDVLSKMLHAVRTAESLLAPCEHLFRFLITRHGQATSDLADEVGERWPGLNIHADALPNLEPHVVNAYNSDRPTQLLETAATSLTDGAWEEAIEALQVLNSWVMRNRKAGPWLTIDGGTLDVRLRGNSGSLPDEPSELYWRHSYYLDPLRRLIRNVEVSE